MPPLSKGRQRLPLGLVVVVIAAATTCLVAQMQFAFASQLRSIGDAAEISTSNARQMLSSAPAKLASSTATRCHPQLGTNQASSGISSWSFNAGCILLLCAATARIALAPKQGCRSSLAKVRCAAAQWSVAGLDAGSLPGTVRLPVSFTQGSVPAAAPAAAAAPALASTPAETLTQRVSLPEPGIMLPAVPVVAEVAAPVHRGLSSARPSLRVGTARCARRSWGIGKGTKASRPGRSRSARRAVGAWLQPKHVAQHVPQAAFDPSRLRMQLQVGLQMTKRTRSGQPRGFDLMSAFTSSVYHSRELPFSIINRNQSQTMMIHSGHQLIYAISACCTMVGLAWVR